MKKLFIALVVILLAVEAVLGFQLRQERRQASDAISAAHEALDSAKQALALADYWQELYQQKCAEKAQGISL